MSRKRGRSPWSRLKPLVDAMLVVLSFGIAYWVRYELQWFRQVEPAYLVPFPVYLPSVAILTVILFFAYWLEGAYRVERGRHFFDELYIVLRGTLTGIGTMIVVVFLASPSYYSRLIFGYTGVVIVVLLAAERAIERGIISRRRKRGLGVDRVLIVGAGEIGRTIMRAVVARPEMGYQIVGFLDDDPIKSETCIGRYPALGRTDRLAEMIDTHQVDEVIIALPWASHQKIVQIMSQCLRAKVRARIAPDLFRMALSSVAVENLDGLPLLGISEPPLRDWQILFKRSIDLVASALALVLLSPVLLVICVAIKLDSPGSPIFKQTRVGRGGGRFTCYKFRSMYTDAESKVQGLREMNEASGPIFKMRQDPRRTKVGRILRRTSLDELPQLWNVLKGEMSIVGPRPALPSEVEQYQPWHLRRLDVSPGITGLWQVSGRSDLTFDEMVLLDIYYIENWSPFLDLRILTKTVPTAVVGRGAY